jgi:hypothetical protein
MRQKGRAEISGFAADDDLNLTNYGHQRRTGRINLTDGSPTRVQITVFDRGFRAYLTESELPPPRTHGASSSATCGPREGEEIGPRCCRRCLASP